MLVVPHALLVLHDPSSLARDLFLACLELKFEFSDSPTRNTVLLFQERELVLDDAETRDKADWNVVNSNMFYGGYGKGSHLRLL